MIGHKRMGCLLFLALLLAWGMAVGAQPPANVTHLDLQQSDLYTTEEILEVLGQYPNVQSVVFGRRALSATTLDALQAAYPDLEMEYGFVIGKKTIRSNEASAVVKSKLDVDQLIEDLKYLPNLREFENFESRYSYEQMEALSQRYPDLHMRCTLNFRDHRVHTTVTAFSTLHNSTKSERHNQDDFLILKYIDHLLALDLGHNAITDISFLEHFPNLRVLILADNQIDDLEPIRNLTDLEYLEIFRNPIDNVEPLSGLTNLLDLNASYCNLTDATPLLGLTQLQRLWISQNTWTLSNEQQEQLRTHLPHCEFNFDTTLGSSAAGWRKNNSRYPTVKKIFDTRKYREFSQ